MKTVKNHRALLVSVIAALCLMLACFSLVACGGGQSGSSAAPSSSSSSKALTPSEQIVGTWKIAALEQNGVLIGGNLGNIIGEGNQFGLTFNADGTGAFASGAEAYDFTWTEGSDGSINMTPTAAGGANVPSTPLPVTVKDDAVFLTMDMNGQQANMIFTKDGTYSKAKVISTADAKPITSESALLGTWTLVGLNMGGVCAYGDADALKSAMGGSETSITFKQGGVAEMSDGTGSWTIDSDGVKLTATDITGTNTIPVMALGDDIVVDFTQAYGGTEFLFVFAKTK